MRFETVAEFDDRHDGDVFLTHRWQKHLYQTEAGTLIAPVHHFPPGSTGGQTHIYRREQGWEEFRLAQTLSDEDIDADGDINTGIIVEGDGVLYATGHSRRSLAGSAVEHVIDAIPLLSDKLHTIRAITTKPTRHRTTVIYKSTDDGRTWSVHRDRTAQSRPDPPHPHNAFWDDRTNTLWWLVGHDGIRLQRYDPVSDQWTDAYSGTRIERDDRLPVAMARIDDRLWLACEVSGPDARQLYYSDDDGMTWQPVENEFRNPSDAANDGLWSISHDPESNTLFVAGGRLNEGQSFVSKSVDSGESWTQVYSGRRNSDAWTTYFNGTLFVADGPGPLLYSTNGGDSFSKMPTPRAANQIEYPKFVELGIKKLGDIIYLIDQATIYQVHSFKNN